MMQTGFCGGAISVLVPAFGGGDLGKNVGTLLSLELWRSVSIPPGEVHQASGTEPVVVEWSSELISPSSFEAAEKIGHARGVSIVLWGSLVRFGEGIIAQPFLSIIPDEKGENIAGVSWPELSNGSGSPQLSVTIPSLRYELPPIYLGKSRLEQYADPSSVDLYRGAEGEPPTPDDLGPPIGKLGDSYKWLYNSGDFTRVVNANNEKGWIYLRKMAGEKEVIAFVVGVARLLSGDHTRAVTVLEEVSNSQAANGALKIDSLLLQALAARKLNGDPSQYVDAAERIKSLSSGNC
jgi:hypothetical protein